MANKDTAKQDDTRGIKALMARVKEWREPEHTGALLMFVTMILLGGKETKVDRSYELSLIGILKELGPQLAKRVIQELHKYLDDLERGRQRHVEQLQTGVKPGMVKRVERFIPGGKREKALNAAAMGYGIFDENDPLAHLDHEPRLEGE